MIPGQHLRAIIASVYVIYDADPLKTFPRREIGFQKAVSRYNYYFDFMHERGSSIKAQLFLADGTKVM